MNQKAQGDSAMPAGARDQRFRRALYGVLAVTILAVIIAGGYFALSLSYGVDDAYALWGAADMVIDYSRTHQGAWPRTWDDLRPQFNVNNGRVGGWTYGQFQGRIKIDFNADPDQLYRKSIESRQATFRVIWAKWDFGVRIGDDPNQMLFDYFRREYSR